VLPVGGAALTVELGEVIDPDLNARVRALDASLSERPLPGVLETVPTYRSMLVVYDPRAAGFADLRDALVHRLQAPASAGVATRVVEVPTAYGGDNGPDLEEVAARLGLAPAEVVARHAAGAYTAFMLGFTPGFAYLGLLAPELATPRRATPRHRVPAGSVAVAGRQTAVYPSVSPGGWNLIGRTALRAWDPASDPPALIRPGDRVRFVAVPELEAPRPAAETVPVPEGAGTVEVLEGGLLTTVQDVGRFGRRRLGVGWSGAADGAALAAANHAVGNPAETAALECTVAGPVLRFLAATRFAIAGADLGAVLQRADLGAWPVPIGRPALARPGNVLSFTGRRAGCRAYVAFAGGLDVPAVLGSRATDIGAGFGGFAGRPLRAGDLLALGRAPVAVRAGADRPPIEGSDALAAPPTIRVVLGPQDAAVERSSIAAFLDASWTVGLDSDRIGCRLDGPRLAHGGPAEIVSDGMVPGCIQVPPDGRPIVMMADCPTTGGYPKIAAVVPADLPRLAQVLPGGGDVRFRAVSVGEAERANAAAGWRRAGGWAR
jgi:KipI family sensor histidine kinase inhibitor